MIIEWLSYDISYFLLFGGGFFTSEGSIMFNHVVHRPCVNTPLIITEKSVRRSIFWLFHDYLKIHGWKSPLVPLRWGHKLSPYIGKGNFISNNLLNNPCWLFHAYLMMILNWKSPLVPIRWGRKLLPYIGNGNLPANNHLNNPHRLFEACLMMIHSW